MNTHLKRLMTVIEPREITYNSTMIALAADHFESEGASAVEVASIRRSARLIHRCGDTSGEEFWRKLRKESPLHRRIFVSLKAPQSFLEEFYEKERRRAHEDVSKAIELDRRIKDILQKA